MRRVVARALFWLIQPALTDHLIAMARHTRLQADAAVEVHDAANRVMDALVRPGRLDWTRP